MHRFFFKTEDTNLPSDSKAPPLLHPPHPSSPEKLPDAKDGIFHLLCRLVPRETSLSVTSHPTPSPPLKSFQMQRMEFPPICRLVPRETSLSFTSHPTPSLPLRNFRMQRMEFPPPLQTGAPRNIPLLHFPPNTLTPP